MRLIDAEQFEVIEWRGNSDEFDNGVMFMAEKIDNAPTIDAVEIVRCKDCKHNRELNESEEKYLIEGVLICENCEATDSGWNPVLPEHYCSYGEKREG